jgi:Lon protease-like protein
MTLPSVNLFPQAMLPLHIFEPRYRRMLRDSLASHRMFCVAMRRPGCHREVPSRVAGLGLIRACVDHADGTSNLVLQGVARVRLMRVLKYRPYRLHAIERLSTKNLDTVAVDALAARLLELVAARLKGGSVLPVHMAQQLGAGTSPDQQETTALISLGEVLRGLARLNNPEQLADLVSCTLLGNAEQRQAILEAVDLESRLRSLIRFLLADAPRPTQS